MCVCFGDGAQERDDYPFKKLFSAVSGVGTLVLLSHKKCRKVVQVEGVG